MAKSSFWIWALLGLLLFNLAANYVWQREGTCLYGKDVSLRLLANSRFYNELHGVIENDSTFPQKARSFLSLFRVHLVPTINIWTDDTKLGYLSLAIIALAAGNSPIATLLWGNWFWLALMLFSVYMIGKEIMGSGAGFCSAFFLSLYPAVFGISRKFGLDLPQMAVVSLAIFLLIKSRGFRSRRFSLIFGLVVGLGLLVKNSMVVFVVGPWIYAIFLSPKVGGETDSKGRLSNCLWALTLFLAVSSVWWSSPQFFQLMRDWGVKHATERAYDSITPHGLPHWLFYPAYLVEFVSPLFCFLAAFVIFPFIASKVKNKGVVFSWLLVPLLILTICRAKWGSWCLTVLPAIALITACGLLSVRRARLRRILIMTVSCLALIQFFGLSFGFFGLDNVLATFGFNREHYYWELQQTSLHHVWYHPPRKNNYRAVMDEFSAMIQPQDYLRLGMVEVRDNWHTEDAYALEYYLRLKHPGFIIFSSISVPEAFFKKYRCSNYFIVMAPKGRDLPAREDYPSLSDAEFKELLKLIRESELLEATILMPQGFSIALYRRLPVRISGDATISADRFYEGNIFVSHPTIGSNPAIGGIDSGKECIGEECDSPLPTRVWEKPEAEPYYVVYELFFERGGRYSFSVEWEGGDSPSGPVCSLDRIAVGEDEAIEVSEGLHQLKFESRTRIPAFSAILFKYEGTKPVDTNERW